MVWAVAVQERTEADLEAARADLRSASDALHDTRTRTAEHEAEIAVGQRIPLLPTLHSYPHSHLTRLVVARTHTHTHTHTYTHSAPCLNPDDPSDVGDDDDTRLRIPAL